MNTDDFLVKLLYVNVVKNETVVLKYHYDLKNFVFFSLVALQLAFLLLFFKVLKGDIEQDGCLSVVYKLICLHYRLYCNGPIMY